MSNRGLFFLWILILASPVAVIFLFKLFLEMPAILSIIAIPFSLYILMAFISGAYMQTNHFKTSVTNDAEHMLLKAKIYGISDMPDVLKLEKAYQDFMSPECKNRREASIEIITCIRDVNRLDEYKKPATRYYFPE